MCNIACHRNDGGMAPGQCQSVYDCPAALRLMRNGITPKEAQYLRGMQCQGDQGSYPWICCEPMTPVPDATTKTESNGGPSDVYFPDGGDSSNQQATSTERPTTRTGPKTGSNSAEDRPRGGEIAAIGTCGLDAFGQRIYGGQVAGLNEFPWMALLQYRNSGRIRLYMYTFRLLLL